MSDIGFISQHAYDHGMDPIEWAVTGVIWTEIDVWLTVRAGRAEDPDTFPGYWSDLSADALSRRILGQLLDAGWTPPSLPEPTEPKGK